MFQSLELYKILCILRIGLVVIPQIGYIHPDEHFQGPEIVYGDITRYNVLKTWEFTSSEPIRSIISPYFVTVIPAVIIKSLTLLQYEVGSYLLLILPRVIMCALSFLQDVCIYKICITNGTDYKPSLILFASSYVTLVYFTRTFSNSLESLFFAFILFLLFKSYKIFPKLIHQENLCVFRQFIYCSFMCGITLSYGFFIRPTFICFCFFPMIIWFYMFCKSNNRIKVNILISFLLGSFSMIICLVSIDSFYYSKVNFSSIYDINIICTPINFILYNVNTSNLNSHGLHSRLLHIFINVPLLFSIYGIILFFYFMKKLYNLFYKLEINLEILLLLSFFSPLSLLSVIPHQEPRFLIPLIIPLSLLYNRPYFRSYLSKKLYIGIWISSNIMLLLFYGFIHQAGVYLSIHYLSNKINNSSVIFYKTYMPPQYLLALKENKNASIHDFRGLVFEKFEYEIQNIIVNNKPSKVFVVLPYKVLNLDITFEALTMSAFKFTERIDLFPHLSTENLPNFINIWHILQNRSKLYDLKEIFSIQIIAFER